MKDKLSKYQAAVNIAEEFLDEDTLNKISMELLENLRQDEDSMQEWLEYSDKALELTELHREEKNTPFPKCSNIKFPMITTAVTQWASRAVPELLKNGEVCKYRVIGRDPDGLKTKRGYRVKTHINWQILEKMTGWFDGRDKLFTQVAVVGTMFTKTWYDPILGRCRSELVPYDCLVVNNAIKTLEEAPQICHYISMTSNDMIEHIRWGLYRDVDVENLVKDLEDATAVYHEIVECHCWWDLDDDGYAEPYIVTIHKASQEVLRIVARWQPGAVQKNDKGQIKRITPDHYFSDYHFIPNPSGSFFSLGFGTLLLDMNETTNTILNQEINAGHLATTQGGFIGSDLRATKEQISIGPGEWRFLNNADGSSLRDNIFPLTYQEPSTVLYQLMLFLVESAQSLTSTTDVVTGNQDELQNVSPNTIQSLMQQSLKVYSSIQSRMFRGFKKELSKIVVLNSKYVDTKEYINLIDPDVQELTEMFDRQGNFLDYKAVLEQFDIVPVVDSNVSTEAEDALKAQQLFNIGTQWAQFGVFNMRELGLYMLDKMGVEGHQKLVVPPPDPNAPNPAMIQMQMEIEKIKTELQLKTREVAVKEFEAKLEAERTQADIQEKGLKVGSDLRKAAVQRDTSEGQLQVQREKNQIERERIHTEAETRRHEAKTSANTASE